MSWEDVHQPSTDAALRDADVTVSLGLQRGNARLFVSISHALVARLGWVLDERLTLRVGRDHLAGQVMLSPDPNGRPLAVMGKAQQRRVVRLAVPDDMAGWKAPPTHVTDFTLDIKARALRITLPWDLSDDEAEGAQEGATADAA